MNQCLCHENTLNVTAYVDRKSFLSVFLPLSYDFLNPVVKLIIMNLSQYLRYSNFIIYVVSM